MRTLESIDYAENGTVLDSVQTPKDVWGSVAPDSIGEKVVNAVCSYKPVKKPHRK
jgi:hypothetical protein